MPTLKRVTPSISAAGPSTGAGLSVLEVLGIVLSLGPLLLRATTGTTTLPLWDLDPLVYPIPMSGVGPALSIVLDVLVLMGAACLLLAQRARDRGVSALAVCLAAAGAIPVLWHAMGGGGSLHDQRIGFSWMAGIFGAVGVYHAGREPAVRRVLAAVALGFLALLAIKSLQQVFIDHPQTVADFRQSKSQLLAAHGWAPGSPAALAFERRLSQPEASGWFGLSNVLATLVSGLAVAAIGLAISACRRPHVPRAATAGIAGLAAAGLACLWLAGAKGGWLSFAAGVSALGMLSLLARTASSSQRWGKLLAGLIGPAAVLGALALVAARGAIGERLGELSLLFRWFYAQGAMRIFAEHPLLGVGPDGFQSAYSLAKPPLSVEDVTSPHAVVYDWIATLGVLGTAWVALLLLAGLVAGRGAASPQHPTEPEPAGPTRNEVRLTLGLPAAATLTAAFLELALRSPDAITVRIIGLLAWCVGSWAVLRAVRQPAMLRVPLAAGAVALLAHGQIDVAASFPSSAGLFLLLLGLAAAPEGTATTARGFRASFGPLVTAAVPAALATVVAYAALGAWRWERHLIDAAGRVARVADLGQRLRLSADPTLAANDPTLSPRAVLADLSAAAGRPVEPTSAAVGRAMTELELASLAPASEGLLAAYQLQPTDRRPLREATRLMLRRAEILSALGQPGQAREAASLAITTFGVLPTDASQGKSHLRAPDFRWAANLHERRAALLNDDADLRTAIALHAAALTRDPYNLEHALKAFRLAVRLGEPTAQDWARRCLELDKLQRLDAGVKGLTDADRSEIARAAAGA